MKIIDDYAKQKPLSQKAGYTLKLVLLAECQDNFSSDDKVVIFDEENLSLSIYDLGANKVRWWRFLI